MFKNLLNGVLSFAEKIAADYNGRDESKEAPKKEGSQSFPKKQNNFSDEDARQESMKSSQGKSDFSGSSYNGPGNVDREKRNSNMSQRNY